MADTFRQEIEGALSKRGWQKSKQWYGWEWYKPPMASTKLRAMSVVEAVPLQLEREGEAQREEERDG